MENNHLVYILKCKDDTLYTGYTTNMERRLKMHESGKGAKYTRGRGPFTVMYQEMLATKEAALSREYEIKKLQRHEKLTLIKEEKGKIYHANSKKL
ncbi:GIY-YIG nuclease family protein [Pseudogracilibacillus auburnensis]|uniref:Putative endonuclease n=1 Tax=Pseudogracilibacillus auburnensis TaxID=1494959 RepID=A0A2V3VJY0_9BACI|nr:GIY-YIG nuclease family protein [Pseudogracilibacillus auburnensis]MBO1004471.1 GIY-YIG nuclease family protein [Pseudogracilibacillus auburnensis]PXW81534.1 putative endonuclease [Pseudogracilibacillus auburnensis]